MALRVVTLVAAALFTVMFGVNGRATQSESVVSPDLTARVAAAGSVPVIVGLKAAPSSALDQPDLDTQREFVQRTLADVVPRAEALADITVGHRFEHMPFFTTRVNATQLAALAAMAEIASIVEDVPERAHLADTVPLVRAPEVWAAGSNGAGWTVVVLDSGVDKTHPFLAGKVTAEACFSNAGGGGGGTSLCPGGASSSTDVNSGVNCDPTITGCDHGTHVAGIIAGSNGPNGMSGIAPGASLISIQVFTRGNDATLCGTGRPTPCIVTFPSDQAAALDHVRTLAGRRNVNRIAAVNMSHGGGRFTEPMGCAAANPSRAAAVANLRAAGIATIASAGNDGYTNAFAAPACLPGVMAISSTTKTDQFSAFTNRGAFPIVAPGEGVVSSVPAGAFAAKSGTSMAAAHIAGAWAVLKQVEPAASVSRIFVAMSGSGASIADPFNPGSLWFRLNLAGARTRLLTTTDDVPGTPGRPTATVNGGSVTLAWAPPATGGVVQNYMIEAGTYSSGTNIGTFFVGSAMNITASPGPGIFFIRVRAANTSGVSEASEETVFSIGGSTAVPGSPRNPQVSVTGDTVTISWSPPTYGGPPANYIITAGSRPGLANIATIDVGNVTSFTVIAPAGTYYIRIRAANAAGVSFSTGELDFTVGNTGAPGRPGTPVATVSGPNVTITWSPPTVGGAATSYLLVAGSSSGTANYGTFNMGASTSITAAPGGGTYFVRIIAVNASGQGLPSAETAFTIGGAGVGSLDGTWNGQTSQGGTVGLVVSGGVITQILAGGATSPTCLRHSNDEGIGVPISGGSFTYSAGTPGIRDTYTISGTFGATQASGTLTYASTTSGPGSVCGTVTATWTATNAGVGRPFLPLAPTGLNAAVGAGSVNLTWLAPGVEGGPMFPYQGGAVVSYDVEVGTSSGASNTGVFSATETGYTVGNLAPGTYFARVRARNLSGAGRPSTEVSFTVSTTAPSYNGTWTGTTAQGKPVTVVISGGLVTSVSFGFTINGGGGCTFESTTNDTMSSPVSGNQFHYWKGTGDPTYVITGTFASTTTVSGTIHVTNSLTSGCVGSQFFSWTATR